MSLLVCDLAWEHFFSQSLLCLTQSRFTFGALGWHGSEWSPRSHTALDVVGLTSYPADSEAQFRELALSIEKQEEWFAVADEKAAIARGLEPSNTQCIGFSVPLVFAESGPSDTAYVADLYEHVSFLGDLNHQIADLPEGAKVRLRVGRKQ